MLRAIAARDDVAVECRARPRLASGSFPAILAVETAKGEARVSLRHEGTTLVGERLAAVRCEASDLMRPKEPGPLTLVLETELGNRPLIRVLPTDRAGGRR